MASTSVRQVSNHRSNHTQEHVVTATLAVPPDGKCVRCGAEAPTSCYLCDGCCSWEPESATYDDVLRGGRIMASGYVPHTIPGQYMELWSYRGYAFMLVLPDGKPVECHKLGLLY